MTDIHHTEITDARAQELHETEVEKIRSEIKRNAAEERKQSLEALEIQKRLDQKWYRARFFMEALFGGLVAAGLLAIWYVDFFGPQLQKEERNAKLENQAFALEARAQKAKNDVDTLQLKDQNRVVERQLLSLKEENKKLAIAQKASEEAAKKLRQESLNLAAALADLSDTEEFQEDLRQQFAALAENEQRKVRDLEAELTALKSARDETQKRQNFIRKQQIVGTWNAVTDGTKDDEPLLIAVDSNDELQLSVADPTIDVEFKNAKLAGRKLTFSVHSNDGAGQIVGHFAGEIKSSSLIEGKMTFKSASERGEMSVSFNRLKTEVDSKLAEER